MGTLTKEQFDQIKLYLDASELSYDPLKTELIDHIASDVDERMRLGVNFVQAWEAVKKEMPTNHFKHIETETMESIKQKMNPVRILAFISFALLVFATIFKMLHLPGAGYMLLMFLIGTAVTSVVGFSTNAYVHKASKGKPLVAVVAMLFFSLLIYLIFSLLHLPGATVLKYISVLSIAIILPIISIYFHQKKGEAVNHLLIRLIESNDKLIGTVVFMLIAFGLAVNYEILISEKDYFPGVILLIFAIVLSGFRAFSWSWRYYVVEANSKYKLSLLVASSVAMVMFILPVLGRDLTMVMRHILAAGAFLIFNIITIVYYRKISIYKNRKWLVPLVSLLTFYPFIKLGVVSQLSEGLISQVIVDPMFSITYVSVLALLLVLFRKERMFMTVVIMSIAYFMIRMY